VAPFLKIAKSHQSLCFYSYRHTNKKSALRGLRPRVFAKAYSGSTAVLVDEFDAGHLASLQFAELQGDFPKMQVERPPSIYKWGFNMLSFLIALGDPRMGQVLVRNLDDRVIESLKTKADLKGRSLEQELRDVLTNAAPLTPAEKVALFHKLRATTPPLGEVDLRAAIRRGRDDEFNE